MIPDASGADRLIAGWAALSRRRACPLSALARDPEAWSIFLSGLKLVTAGRSRAAARRGEVLWRPRGATRFRRLLSSFLNRHGGWLAADTEEVLSCLRRRGDVAPAGSCLEWRARPPLADVLAPEEFSARLTQAVSELERDARERKERAASLNRDRHPGRGDRESAPRDEDAALMEVALRQAEWAGERGEVPVGAALVLNGEVVAQAGNRCRATLDPLAHAEVLVLSEACRRLGTHRLAGATLYVTLEPCPMCAAAAELAQVDRVVWGADDPLGGCLTPAARRDAAKYRFERSRGVAAARCGRLLSEFFAALRRSRA